MIVAASSVQVSLQYLYLLLLSLSMAPYLFALCKWDLETPQNCARAECARANSRTAASPIKDWRDVRSDTRDACALLPAYLKLWMSGEIICKIATSKSPFALSDAGHAWIAPVLSYEVSSEYALIVSFLHYIYSSQVLVGPRLTKVKSLLLLLSLHCYLHCTTWSRLLRVNK